MTSTVSPAGVLTGRGVSPGVVSAPVVRLGPPVSTSPDDPVGADPAVERERVAAALAEVADDLAGRAERAGGVAADVLFATSAMAADPALLGAAGAELDRGAPTGHAVTLAVRGFCERLRAHGGYLAERAADLRDVGERVVAVLSGQPMPGVPAPGHPVVLVATDLSPADTAGLAGGDVVGLLTEQGGPTSHTAILARALGLPAVVGCAGAGALAPGTPVRLDGTTGTVEIDPPEPGDRGHEVDDGAGQSSPSLEPGPGRTADGHPVPLLTNVGSGPDALAAAATDSEGVGLLRTELLFLDRAVRPSVDEQARIYAAVLAAFGERPVVVRTLDAGSDKPLAFLPLGPEDNPALGVRGLRTSGANPGVLDEQLAALAMAAAGTGRTPSVMAPMVSTAQEAAAFAEAAHRHGLTRVGVMVEVPSAALRAAELFEVVDFVSIGTNDLGQYVMAADRACGPLGHLLDPWQPALLDLVAMVGAAGAAAGKPVGVCGEAAADPLLATVLVGLGATSLSTAAGARAHVRAALAAVGMPVCRERAAAARSARGPDEARAAAAAVGPDAVGRREGAG
ncbi:putative PEP-binding protein [Pseudonocardia humida]|uniref:Phosphoenolpyruvate-protein phosphotransferase n=1 Tax=Pseudonocardia humida TaxID=2800819 RepID=A0ABT1AB11_9PSEU|nr:putative PEP-binding protein [Pseudonocardia humida]MCO1660123.1 phosphoenolpyruvate--protein phosphotransferase [Pseudonocardia humida]